MSLDSKTRRLMEQALATVDEHGNRGPRLVGDAQRLIRAVRSLLHLKLIHNDADLEALDLACYALQLPMRQTKLLASGKLGRINLRERAEQSAELLVGSMGTKIDEALLDRTTRLLQEAHHRSPMIEDAKILADAVNLDDFGIVGLLGQAIQLARQGGGVAQVLEGAEKREQYGYWEARLKDGFHFEPVRRLAERRLEHARAMAKLLADEMGDALS